VKLDIGSAIRRARELSGYSQDGLAYLVGCPQPYISKIENGRSVPPVEQIARIALALGTTASMIVRDAETFMHVRISQTSLDTNRSVQ
jgi:transcriptional regulator with XRE-family HTH domain